MAIVARHVLRSGAKVWLGLCEEGDAPLQNTFWRHEETTNILYTKLHAVNHNQSVECLNEIIASYGRAKDCREAAEKFQSYVVSGPK